MTLLRTSCTIPSLRLIFLGACFFSATNAHSEDISKTTVSSKTFISETAEATPRLIDWDARGGLNFRSYPIGAQLTSTVGAHSLLWGDPNSWKYGYIRLAANAATSVVVNRIGFEAQVNPISILTLSAGYDLGVRNYTPKYINTAQYTTDGQIDRKYLKANLVAAYKTMVVSFLARYENLRAFSTAKPFFDEMTLLTGHATGESVFTMNPALLYTLNDQVRVGATMLFSHATDSGGVSNLYGPVALYSFSPAWNVLGGVGINHSPVVHSGIAAFFVMSYTFKAGLSITDALLRTDNHYSSLF